MSAIVADRTAIGWKTVQKNKELPKNTSNKPCFKCGELGHWYQDCPENKPLQEQPQEKREPAPKKKTYMCKSRTRKKKSAKKPKQGSDE